MSSDYRTQPRKQPGGFAAADEWHYCPVCETPDPSPVELVESRFATEWSLNRHLLQNHDKTDLVAALVEEVRPR